MFFVFYLQFVQTNFSFARTKSIFLCGAGTVLNEDLGENLAAVIIEVPPRYICVMEGLTLCFITFLRTFLQWCQNPSTSVIVVVYIKDD